ECQGRCVRPPDDGVVPRVMVDPAIGTDEAADTRLIDLVEGVETSPCREHYARLHAGIGGENDLPIVARHDGRELGHEVGTTLGTVILDHDTAVLEVGD